MSSSHQSTTSSSSLVTAYSAEDTFMQSSSGYEPVRGTGLPPNHVTLQAQASSSSAQPTRPVMNSNSNSNTPVPITGSRISSVWSQFGATVSNVSKARPDPRKTETIDFMDTYVNVYETDADEVDIILAGGDPGIANQYNPAANTDQEQGLRGDILTILLSGPLHLDADADADSEDGGGGGETIVTQCEDANRATARAAQAKKDGNLQEALDAHTQAAKLFREAAIHIGEGNGALCYTMLHVSLGRSRSFVCTCTLC